MYTPSTYSAYTQLDFMTKPVQLSDEAYRRLTMTKRPGESFSDVVLRLTRRGSLSSLSGLGRSKDEVQRHEKEIERMNGLDRVR